MEESVVGQRERAVALLERLRRDYQDRFGVDVSAQDVVLGLVGDVGLLAQAVLEGGGDVAARTRVASELADLQWSVLVLAELFEVDLDASFDRVVSKLERSLDGSGAAGQHDQI